MSDLSFLERRDFENLLGMSSGFVLNFTDQTFQDFIVDCVRLNIYDDRFSKNGQSKAKRLRCFWSLEANHVVGKLLADLLKYHKNEYTDFSDAELLERCHKTVVRLLNSSPLSDIEKLNDAVSSKDAVTILNAINDAVRRNEPEAALDRLHTFVVAFARERCDMHKISHNKGEPLNSTFGKFVNQLRDEGKVESKMASLILREAVKILDAFNDVRNNHSSAHANQLLSQNEALLILGWVRSTIDFVLSVDPPKANVTLPTLPTTYLDEDLPF